MPIAVTPRKGLRARRLAETRPDLPPADIAKLTGLHPGAVAKAKKQETFGRQTPKSRAR